MIDFHGQPGDHISRFRLWRLVALSVHQDWSVKLVALLAGLGIFLCGRRFINEAFMMRHDVIVIALAFSQVPFLHSIEVIL